MRVSVEASLNVMPMRGSVGEVRVVALRRVVSRAAISVLLAQPSVGGRSNLGLTSMSANDRIPAILGVGKEHETRISQHQAV